MSGPVNDHDGGRPVGVITDRDLALAVVADEVEAAANAGDHTPRARLSAVRSRWISEEAVAVINITSAVCTPVTRGHELFGIVTIDDLAVRAGDLHLAQQITAEVAKAALPEFYFHQRGG